jgi:hypothetical protein
MSDALRRHLHTIYGPANKSRSVPESCDHYHVDDRGDGDYGGDKALYLWFVPISVTVLRQQQPTLWGPTPPVIPEHSFALRLTGSSLVSSTGISSLVESRGGTASAKTIQVNLTAGDGDFVRSLATEMEAVGDEGLEKAQFRHRPRIVASLRRLAGHLDSFVP